MAQLTISDDLAATLRQQAARRGVSVEQLLEVVVRRERFWQTVAAVQAQNTDLTPEEADGLANEAVEWARATRP